MWALCTILVVVAASVRGDPDSNRYLPYVQSRSAFTHARLYLQENVALDHRPITNSEKRKHVAFGMIAAVTGTIAKNYSDGGSEDKWLDILDEHVPKTWEDYNSVAYQVNQLLAEANAKIQPMTSLIDAICSTTTSVNSCNRQVAIKVHNSDEYIQRRARLLLALGKVSNTLKNHEKVLRAIVNGFNVVPYLIKQIEDVPTYKQFINDLGYVYQLLRKHNPQSYNVSL